MRVSMRFTVIIAIVTMGLSTLSLGTADPVGAQSHKLYVVMGAGNVLPVGFEALVSAAGGRVVHQLDEIGVAVVESVEPSFLAAVEGIAGVQGAAEDRPVPLALPETVGLTVVENVQAGASEAAAAEGQNPGKATFLSVQWNLEAVRAVAAWNEGFGNPQVKVAVLDTGIDYTQQEMVGQVDASLSRSYFTEPLPPGAPAWLDVHGHGTHVAGIIAAKGISVAGVAPSVRLVAFKIAGRSGFTTLGTIAVAIKAAADAGADVINMSFGDVLAKGGRENAQLMAALNRAVNYAHGRGALLVASAGNSGINWDRARSVTANGLTYDNPMKVPAQLPHVVAVSATGPQFGAKSTWDAMGVNGGPNAMYSDHGMSIITFAAPGGSATPYVNALGMPADRILSACARFTPGLKAPGCTSGRANIFMIGTSMAAAHVSGVAALIDSAHGGALNGDQILSILMRSAQDLGKPGKDGYYGVGRVNAYRAVNGK